MKTVFACVLCLMGNLIADEFALEGTWKALTTMPEGEDRPSTVVISKKDGKLEGVASTSDGERAVKDIVVTKEEVTFALDLEYEGTPFTFKVTAKPEGADTLKGGWDAVGDSGDSLASGDWQAAREVVESNPLVGDWKVAAKDPDGNDLSFDMVVAESDGKLSGSMKSKDGSMDFKSIAQEDDEVTLVVPFPYDGEVYPITIKATLDGDHLKGAWTALNADGKEEASGEWKAEREGAPTFVGVWEVAATMADETENKATYHIEAGEKEGTWKGKATSEAGDIAFDKVAIEEDGVTIDMELPYNDAKIEVRVKAKMSEDGSSFKGEWIAFDESGQEAARGALKAARKTES